MYLLAFETSCDDTSVAILQDGEVVDMETRSQTKAHNQTQGVVPEVAARLHADAVFEALGALLERTRLTLADIHVIACTNRPGLLPSLLVGMTVTKTLAHLLKIPLIWVNHIEAHIFANLIERDTDADMFPAICLTVSGGHNELYRWDSLFSLTLLGATQDDAAGEAFDKVAKMLGLGYPGWPIVSRLASEWKGSWQKIFPVPLASDPSLNFSFSGLKTAVRYAIERRKATRADGILTQEDQQEICYEFERAAVEALRNKTMRALSQYSDTKTLCVTGGVSANTHLVATLQKEADTCHIHFLSPAKKAYTQDNAAMVGRYAYLRWQYEQKHAHQPSL